MRGKRLFTMSFRFVVHFIAAWALVAVSVSGAWAFSISEIPDSNAVEDATITIEFSLIDNPGGTITFTKTSSNTNLLPSENIIITGGGNNRTLTLVPEADRSGSTTVTITATAGGETDTETFFLTVQAEDDAPFVEAPDAATTTEETELVFSPANENLITVGDIDAGNNAVDVTLRSDNGTVTVRDTSGATVTGNGSAEVAIRGTVGQITGNLSEVTYLPDTDFTGTDRLRLLIDDNGHTGIITNPFAGGSLQASKSISITVEPVNDPPSVSLPEDQTVAEDTPLAFGPETGNMIQVADPDAGENPVVVTISLDKGTLDLMTETEAVVTGTDTPELQLAGDIETINAALEGLVANLGETTEAGGNFTVAPHWTGTATLTVAVDDQGYTGAGEPLSAEESLAITVTPVNDAPVIKSGNVTPTINEDQTFNFTLGNRISIEDPDAGDADIFVGLEVNEGTLTLAEVADLDIQRDGNDVTMTGPVELINQALTGLAYTGPADWSGDAEIIITADDQGNSGEGGAQSSTKMQMFVVQPVNDAPTVTNTNAYIMTAIDPNTADPAGELVSDILEDRVADPDAEGGEGGIAVVEVENENGTWQFSTDGGDDWTDFNAPLSDTNATLLDADALVRFVPDTDWEGIARLFFRAWDGSDNAANGASGVDVSQNGEDTPFSIETGAVSITVGEPPRLIANAGPNQTVTEGTTVILDGGDSEFPPLMTVAFAWSQVSGTAVTITDPASLQTSFTAPTVGAAPLTLVFQLTLTTEGEPSASDTVEITVVQDMTIIASAGLDQTATEGATVTLNGSGSQIPEGLSVAVAWSQDAGPAVTLANPGTLTPTFTAPEVDETETLTFTLTLTDPDDQSFTDAVSITVNPRPPIQADAGSDRTVREGETVTLSAANSAIPAGVSPLYQWTQTAGNAVVLANPAAVETTFIAPEVAQGQQAVLTFQVTVSDTQGDSDTDTVTIRVTDDTPAPVPPVANAGPNQNVTSGVSVTLNGGGSTDADGTISAYAWTELTDFGVALSNPNAAVTTFTAPAGGPNGQLLRFQLTVTDNSGLTATDEVVVNVAPDSGSGIGGTFDFQEGTTVTLNATPTPGFGAVTSYQWTQLSGEPTVRLSNPAAVSPTFVAPVVNGATRILVFEVTMANAQGAVQSASVTINVLENGITGYPEDVITFRSTTQTTMGIRLNAGGALVRLRPLSPDAIGDPENQPVGMLYGVLDFGILVDNPGDLASLTIFLEAPAPADYRWFKHDAVQGWHDYSVNATFNADRTRVDLRFIDGGVGDGDATANGIVNDPSGLGRPADGNNGGDGGDGGGDGDGGGCFVRILMN